MTDAPDIRNSSEEERRKYIKDRYPCIADCDMCGLCTVFRGKDAETLEDTIVQMGDELRDLRSEDRANKDAIRVLNKNQRASLQKFGVVRYNAFKEMGGNMSFALAELDYTNSGFIINTVHSREGCYLYIKTVDCGQTEVLLSAEEKEALEQALGYLDR